MTPALAPSPAQLQTIQTAAAFRQIDSEYFAMHTPSTLLNPTVAGIATK
jgi:hypothetical protein